MTNEDYIRNIMTTEELAKSLVYYDVFYCYEDEDTFYRAADGTMYYVKDDAIERNIKWLGEQVDEELLKEVKEINGGFIMPFQTQNYY